MLKYFWYVSSNSEFKLTIKYKIKKERKRVTVNCAGVTQRFCRVTCPDEINSHCCLKTRQKMVFFGKSLLLGVLIQQILGHMNSLFLTAIRLSVCERGMNQFICFFNWSEETYSMNLTMNTYEIDWISINKGELLWLKAHFPRAVWNEQVSCHC